MRLIDYLNPECIEIGLDANDKGELLERMIQLAARNPKVHDLGAVRTAILERESILSTGIGNGCAIPHGKTNGVDEVVASFAVLRRPVEYHALDQEPVQLVLLMVRREIDTKLHLQLLGHASKILRTASTRAALVQCSSRVEVLEVMRRGEDILY